MCPGGCGWVPPHDFLTFRLHSVNSWQQSLQLNYKMKTPPYLLVQFLDINPGAYKLLKHFYHVRVTKKILEKKCKAWWGKE